MSYDVIVSTDSDVIVSPEPNDDVQVALDFEIETINVPEQGPPGLQGNTGTPGADGNTVLYGAGPPSPMMGKDGDFYIDTNAHTMYGPKATLWPATGVSLIGPQGIPGNTVLYGTGPPANSLGVDGNFYIDTSAHYIYGPKASGAWPAGASLVGPQGPQGPQGVQGPQGPPGIQGPPGAVPEAPTDGQQYARQSAAWSPVATGFPSGTSMLFYQATAPVGWTKVTTQNDKTLRVVNGATGGSAGGTNPYSTVMAQSAVGNHTLTLGETAAGIQSSWSTTINVYPAGTSSYFGAISTDNIYTNQIQQVAGYTVPYTQHGGSWTYTNSWSGGASATATSTNTGGGAHNHPITLDIQYCDVIICSKN